MDPFRMRAAEGLQSMTTPPLQRDCAHKPPRLRRSAQYFEQDDISPQHDVTSNGRSGLEPPEASGRPEAADPCRYRVRDKTGKTHCDQLEAHSSSQGAAQAATYPGSVQSGAAVILFLHGGPSP